MERLSIEEKDLVENPNARVPICLVLDTSGSMTGEPIDELNEGVGLFFDTVRNDDVAKYAAEVSVVTFGEAVETLLDFGPIESQSVPILTAGGSTPMGEAINRALDLLEARKRNYANAGVDYYQPWMVLMTDGEPTDEIGAAAQRTTSLINNKKLTIFPIAIGSGANLSTLKKFSPKRPPLRLKGLNFREFFEWLSKSVSRVSQSTPGEKVPLDTEAMKGWAEL